MTCFPHADGLLNGSLLFYCDKGEFSRKPLVGPGRVFVEFLQGEPASYGGIDDFTERVFPVEAFGYLRPERFFIETCVGHFAFENVCGKVAHGGRLFKMQNVSGLGKRMKIAADHFTAGL